MPAHGYYIYILSNTHKHPYIGVTNNLQRRIAEHKSRSSPNAFASRYNIHRLVHFETSATSPRHNARDRNEEVEPPEENSPDRRHDPTWQDLSEEFGKPLPLFRKETKTHPPPSRHYL